MVISVGKHAAKWLAMVGLVTLSLSGCGPSVQDAGELLHNPNEPIRSQEPFNWANVSDAEYRTYMAPLLGLEDNYLAADNAVTKRTQFWIDTFDANLRRRYPDVMTNVPKPTARLIINPSVNAFIAPVPVCLPISLRWANAASTATAKEVYLDAATGQMALWPGERWECRSEPASQATTEMVQGFVRHFNATSANGCKFTFVAQANGAGAIEGNSSCQRSSDLRPYAKADNVVLMRTASWVNVYTGIIPVMTEHEFAAVVAHELGHYYRSHMTAPADFFGYFYQLSESNPTGKPVPDASLQALGNRVLKSSEVVQLGDRFKKAPNQAFHSKIYLAIGSVGAALCGDDDACSAECKPFNKLVLSQDYVTETNFFPFRDLNAAGKTQYAKFEKMAKACLETIPLGSGANDVSWALIRNLIAQPVWPGWLVYSGDIRSTVRKWGTNTMGLVPTTAPTGTTTVAQAFLAMSAAITAAERSADADMRTAYERRLGHYTFEQEADEHSGEWLPQVGIDPKDGVNVYLNFGRWAAARGADRGMPFDVGIEECLRLYKAGWRAADGSYKYIALGDYSDPHHSYCYRAFNLDRDVQAHRFAVGPGVNPPTAGGPNWKEIQSIAQSAADEKNESRPVRLHRTGHGVSPEIAKFWRNDCIFAPRDLGHEDFAH